MEQVKQELDAIKDALKALPGVRLVCTGWPKTFDTLPCVLVQLAGEVTSPSSAFSGSAPGTSFTSTGSSMVSKMRSR